MEREIKGVYSLLTQVKFREHRCVALSFYGYSIY